MANNTNYMVARCQQCGALNVLHKSRIEETIYANGKPRVIAPVRCGECAGELEVIDYAIMQDRTTKGIMVDVTVERGPLDRLIEDVGREKEYVRTHRMEHIPYGTAIMKGI